MNIQESLKNLSYGVYAATVKDEEKSTGCIVNSLIQVTYNTVAVSINHNNHTNICIKKSKHFAISILPEDIDENIIPIFGFQSGKNINKFENIENITISNLNIIPNSISYLILDVINTIETETHTIFIAKITEGDVINPNKKPMTYAYYHLIKKGLTPKNAPTYIEKKSEQKGYRCSICGYIYQGYIKNEPNDFVCPICKQPKNVFKKI